MLTTIIPVYNYERNISKNVEIIERKIKTYFKKYEIIIVDDGSDDNTLNNLKKIVSKNIRILKNKKNIYPKALKYQKFLRFYLYFNKIDKFCIFEENDFVVIIRKTKKKIN